MNNLINQLKHKKAPIVLGFSMNVIAMTAIVMMMPFAAVEAKEFRSIQLILSPKAISAKPGSVTPGNFEPVKSEVVNSAVDQIAESYNTPQMQKLLSDIFFDADSLSDTVSNLVPQDAIVRVLSTQGSRTIQQTIEVDELTQKKVRVSRVEITVSTQLEFNDADGFQALPGTTQYVLDIREEQAER